MRLLDRCDICLFVCLGSVFVSAILNSDPVIDFLEDYATEDQPRVAVFNFLQLGVITWWTREHVLSE